ncbi:HNH endonuclease [Streptomyces sp. NPDC051546]|uniref:HNH endonuclease n=1 Tax=Streptomyces sp. NPDC051546 TaxID=3365655 RepID=UPI00379CF715
MPSALTDAGSSSEWRRIRARVLAEEPECRYCGAPSDTVDHIVPRKYGGDDRRENLAGACTPCNLARGATAPSCLPSREW